MSTSAIKSKISTMTAAAESYSKELKMQLERVRGISESKSTTRQTTHYNKASKGGKK